MAQRVRFDEPGAWLHVMNRGTARRTICESEADFRFLLSAFAQAVRAGWFEIHAYSLLGTHFHLLLRSTVGECWRGLRLAQNAHARRFNIGRHRDGSLFRGRFTSKRVWSDEYWWTVVRYIDTNAVEAGLARRVEDWPWCSAHHYLGGSGGPPWLSRGEVERFATSDGLRPFNAEEYRAAFEHGMGEAERQFVETGLRRPETVDDPAHDLLGASSVRVRAWMVRKAALADGTRPGLPIVTPAAVVAALDARESADRSAPPHRAMRAWLLRAASGCGYDEIAARCGYSASTAHGRVREFRRLLTSGDPAAEEATDLLRAVIGREWPRMPHSQREAHIVTPGVAAPDRTTGSEPPGSTPR